MGKTLKDRKKDFASDCFENALQTEGNKLKLTYALWVCFLQERLIRTQSGDRKNERETERKKEKERRLYMVILLFSYIIY